MNSELQLLAPAKVNLFLETLEKRPDGFHNLETVMTCINLYDRLVFRRRDDQEIRLTVAGPESAGVPSCGKNLVVRALERLRECSPNSFGLDVRLFKEIPSQAGLGGGSSDAATALLAANRMWGAGFKQEALSEIAAELGSDISFFIYGGTAICRGRGELVEPIATHCDMSLVVAKPPVGLSTPKVFSHCQIPDSAKNSVELADGIIKRSVAQLKKGCFNRLEAAAEKLTDWICLLRTAFEGVGAITHQMSGSGSTYFALFPNAKLARNVRARLLQMWPELTLYCCRSIGRLAQHNPRFCSAINHVKLRDSME